MTIKELEDSRAPMLNETFVAGSSVNPTTVTVGTHIWGDAVRSRPRPSILDVTGYKLSRYEVNPTYFDKTTIQLGKLYGRRGSSSHVYPSGARSVTENVNGDAGLTKALAKMSKSSAGWGENLVEGKQTLNMLKNRITSIYRMGMALKRGDIRAAYDALSLPYDPKVARKLRDMPVSKRLSNGYLELSLGLKPLVEDISGTAKAYADGLAKRGSKIGRSSGKVPGKLDWEPGKDLSPLVPVGGYSGVITNPTALAANQLGILNVPQILWDKMPLSFVFDWFIPIGTLLGALTGGAGIGSIRAYTTNQTRTTLYVGPNSGDAHTLWYVSYVGQRVPKNAMPSLDVLQRGSGTDWGKLVTLAALFRQRLG